MRLLKLISCALLLMLACASPQPIPPPGKSAQEPEPKRGVYVEDINRNIQPCQDFFEYANGKWRAEHPIPASQVRWSRRWESGELAKEQLRAILDEVSARQDWKAASVEQQVSDMYASCMDQASIQKAGLAPVDPLLKRIDAAKDVDGIQAIIRELHDISIRVPFGIAADSDQHNPEQVIAHVYAGGLGLPDRDWYFKTEARFVEARDRYQQHVADVLKHAGYNDAAAQSAAAAVFGMEVKLAEASFTRIEQRNPKLRDNKMPFADLGKLAPRFDWAASFKQARIPTGELNVTQPKFVAELNRQLAETPLDTWKHYLKFHLLRQAWLALPDPFVLAHFNFYEKYLGGAQEMKPRWKQCVELTDDLLGEALGRKYVEKHFPPAAKARMEEMVKNLLFAMGETLRKLDWMGPETKQKALEKLSTFNPKIGYPDKWKDYSSVKIRRGEHWQNVVAGEEFNVNDDRMRIGKPVDRARWGMTPPTSNAYYNPLLNEIVFPAGILQPPGFRMEATDAYNYGAIGVVIGHEISHGFDDQGAQYDAQGRLKNWWSEADLKRFQERGQCVVNQFEEYEVEPGIRHQGKLVLGESIGDLAGAKIALLGYQHSRNGKGPEPTIDGFTPEQQFFIGWGQFRGDAIRPETQRLMVQTGPHPTGKFRVIGPLSNLPQFQQAFRCSARDPMVRPPEKRCEVW